METVANCPYLPPAPDRMSWRDLAAWREQQGPEFYAIALAYGQYLWRQGLSARALLAVDRGLYADLTGSEAILADWPLPYRAIGWLVANNPPGVFIGNPRVHYQHLADRVRGERAEQKKWRAWAAWAVVRQVAPDYSADPKHDVAEPTLEQIEDGLTQHGASGEVAVWQALIDEFRQSQTRT
ncbi:hypothetical protein [Cerasicoccus fimbriatus]|uniref:hypothetical protein n=1 Tax=Cerasicoccus fimbriatus TaxID=3014554 RepID=UPI0022B5DC72|nr:hypothetical protein [Cerasicoccus sp. TK19100]